MNEEYNLTVTSKGGVHLNKKDVQDLYKRVKRQKYAKRARSGLIEPTQPKGQSGCQTCGKVTWKPY